MDQNLLAGCFRSQRGQWAHGHNRRKTWPRLRYRVIKGVSERSYQFLPYCRQLAERWTCQKLFVCVTQYVARVDTKRCAKSADEREGVVPQLTKVQSDHSRLHVSRTSPIVDCCVTRPSTGTCR